MGSEHGLTGLAARGLAGSRWPLRRADDVFRLRYGRALTATNRHDGEVPVYGTNGQCGTHDSALFEGPGVVLGRKGQGPLGVEWCDGPHWVIDTGYSLQLLAEDVDLKYSYYLIKYVGLNHLKDGTSNPSLSRDTFGLQLFPMPPLEEQRAIASILGAFDDKIELNRRMNRTLDETAQAIFKSWFVEPVGEVWPSGGSALPGGWSVSQLRDHVEVERGLSYNGAGLADAGDGMPMHNLNSVLEGGGYKSDGLKWYSGEYKKRHLLGPGDLIVTNTEQGFECRLIGFPAVVPGRFGEASLFSHHLYRVRLRPDSPLNSPYLYWLMRDHSVHALVAGFTNGTTVNMLPIDGLQEPRIIIPPSDLVAEYGRVATPMLSRHEGLELESEALGDLRDALLPRLISGEIRVDRGAAAELPKGRSDG